MLSFNWSANGLILAVAILAALLVWDRKKLASVFLIILFSALLGWVIVFILKEVVARDRPSHYFSEIIHIVGVELHQGSFPSGHTQLAFCVATVLAKKYSRSWKFVYPWAVIVAYSRVYVGAHFPLDVIVGAFIGYGTAKLVLWIKSREMSFPRKTRETK